MEHQPPTPPPPDPRRPAQHHSLRLDFFLEKLRKKSKVNVTWGDDDVVSGGAVSSWSISHPPPPRTRVALPHDSLRLDFFFFLRRKKKFHQDQTGPGAVQQQPLGRWPWAVSPFSYGDESQEGTSCLR